MTIDRAVMAFAGTVILVSLALAHWHSAYWLAADGVRRPQFAPGFDDRLLPAGDFVEAVRREARPGVFLTVAPRDFRSGFVGRLDGRPRAAKPIAL